MKRILLGLCSLGAAGFVATSSGQVQVAGSLQVDVDATGAPVGALAYLTNNGAMGGVFVANNNGVASVTPQVIALGGSGTRGVLLDGNQVSLRHYTDSSGTTVMLPPGGLTGANPVFSVEAWAYKPTVMSETALVSWGTRTAGQEVSCNWGRNATWGGFSWLGGGYDHGWNVVPAPGAWRHLVWTYDGAGNLMLYRDGVLDKAAVQTAAVNVNGAYNIVLGVQHAGTGWNGFANGVLAKVRIHDGVLTPEQVLNNYTVELPGFVHGTPARALASAPLHRYAFNLPATNDATGLAVTDTGTANGTPKQADGVVKGNAATANFDGVKINLNGGSSATQAYIDLPNGLLSSLSSSNGGPGQVTFEMWVNPTAQNWSRLFEFGSTSIGEVTGPGGTFSGSSSIHLATQIGGDQEHSQIGGATGDRRVGSRLIDYQKHVVMTWDELNNRLKIYHEGVLVGHFSVGIKMNSINDVNNWLGRSAWNGDANMGGGFREFRIYDRVLSEVEVLRNFRVGPYDAADPNTLVWNGNLNGNWDASTQNWLMGATPASFANGSHVQFDDTATGTTSVDLAATVLPASVAVANASRNYTLSGTGKISGTGSLVKESPGTLTFSGSQANDYTGPTRLMGGKTVVTSLANAGVPSALGAASAHPTNLVLGGTLSYQGAATSTDRGLLLAAQNSTLDVLNSLTVSGPVVAGGLSSFLKTGAGTLVFSNPGANSFAIGVNPGFNVAQGTVRFEGGGTNTSVNELWVGGGTSYPGHMVISGATLVSGSWLGIGRGNGGIGNVSTMTLENGNVVINNNGLAMGYTPGPPAAPTNFASQVLTLNGASTFYVPGNVQIGESTGSSAQAFLNGTSWLRGNSVRMGLSTGSTGALYMANSSVITNTSYTSVGAGGAGVMQMKDSSAFYSTADFNVSDLANSVGQFDIQDNAFLTCGTLFVGKASGSAGVLNQSGGTIAVGGWVSIGRYANSSGTLNVSGGTLVLTNTTTAMIVGEEAVGTLNVSGSGLVIATNDLRIGNVSGANGTVNLDGGTLISQRIYMNNPDAYSTFSFNGGTLKAADGADLNFLSGLSYAQVLAGGAVIDTGTNDIVIAQALYDGGGGGGLTKLGTGSLVLASPLNLSGTTTVNAGKLAVTTGGVGTGGYTVANNAALGIEVSSAGSGIAAPAFTIGGVAGGALEFDLGTFGNPPTAPLSVTGTLTRNGTVTLNVGLDNTLSVGQFSLIQYGSLAGSGSFLLGALPPGVGAYLSNNVAANSIDLVVTNVSLPRWEGLAGGTWDVGLTTNWVDRITLEPLTFQQGFATLFDDAATGPTTVNLTANVNPGGVVVSNLMKDYTFSGTGRIGGGSGIIKRGAATLTVSTANNDYSGTTIVEEGTMVSTVANNLGNNSRLAMGGGTLSLGANNQRFSTVTLTNGNITGPAATVTAPSFQLSQGTVEPVLAGGSVTTFGPLTNTVNLLGVNTYTGRTFLAGSTLQVTNLADGGQPSGVGVSPAAATNIMFTGGGLSYAGPAATTDRGYAINGGGTYSVSSALRLTGEVQAGAGGFTKSGPGALIYARPGTNVLTAGGYYIGNGTVVFDGDAGTPGNYVQTNRINGEVFVGFDQVNQGSLVVSNSSLNISSWLAIDRGNGTNGSASKVTLYDSAVTCGNLSMGYWNNIAGNLNYPVVSLLGNSSLIVGNRSLIGENPGANATVIVAGNSELSLNAEWFALGNSGKGTLILSNNARAIFPNDYNLGDITDGDGTLYISGNATNLGRTLYIAKGANSLGAVYQSGGYLGRTPAGGGDWRIANNATATGTYNLSGGIFDCPGNFQIGAYGSGTWNQSGGVANCGNYPVVGRFTGSVGTMNVSGGVFSQTGGGQLLIIGEESTGTLTVSGQGVVNCAGGLSIGHTASGFGTVNLDGGRLATTRVFSPGASLGGTSTLNFNGGVLAANANNADFMSTLMGAYVLPGGAFIDSSSNSIAIAQPLQDLGGGGLTKLGTGVLTLSGISTYTGMTTIENGFLVVNGQIPGSATVKAGAMLAGNGLVGGTVTVQPGGALSAGTSIGALSLGSSPVLGGSVLAEVDRNGGSPLADLITVSAAPITYAGTLVITNTGADLVANDTFKLFTASGYSGSFTLVSQTPRQNVTWDTSALTTSGTIRVVSAVPSIPTTPTNITFGVSGGNLDLWWPTNYTGWRLEVQTNAITTGLRTDSAAWSTWPNSANVNAVTIPIDPKNPTVFFRLVYP